MLVERAALYQFPEVICIARRRVADIDFYFLVIGSNHAGTRRHDENLIAVVAKRAKAALGTRSGRRPAGLALAKNVRFGSPALIAESITKQPI